MNFISWLFSKECFMNKIYCRTMLCIHNIKTFKKIIINNNGNSRHHPYTNGVGNSKGVHVEKVIYDDH